MEGCPCPACSAGFTRGYIHYAAKAGETTGPRLLTLHNLSYIQRLMADLRDAIDAGDAHRDRRRRSWPAPRLQRADQPASGGPAGPPSLISCCRR